MSREMPPIAAVTILDKEYRVTCPDEEREALSGAARLLDERMREIRGRGKVVGLERIAVMAALNFAHELLQNRSEKDDYRHAVNARIKNIQDKIDAALQDGIRKEGKVTF
ncbi:cell division protein ZapA [Gammaproteobacteria bacterium]